MSDSTFDVTLWRGGVHSFSSEEEARRAAYDDASNVLRTDTSISCIRICILQRGTVVGHVEVSAFRFGMPRHVWSPPDYPSGAQPHLSPEEYAMVLQHRAKGYV